MKVFNSIEEAAEKINKAVVTTGSFDGVHIGHKIIIDRLNQLADEIGGESVLITFHPHPRKVLYPEQTDLKLINSRQEKISLLEKTGLKNLIIHPFSIEFSQTSSYDFIIKYLIGMLNAKTIVIGHNHHFGHNRQGDYSYLYDLSVEHKFTVEEIPLKDIENETVSSTKIRKALKEGNIQRANAYLDHQYIITGPLSNVSALENLNSFKSFDIIIEEKEKLIPPAGIYAANLMLDKEYMKAMAVVNKNSEESGRISIILLYDRLESYVKEATLLLYKKVKDADWPDNMAGFEMSFNIAKEEVEDLIY